MDSWLLILLILLFGTSSALFSSALKHLNSDDLPDRARNSKAADRLSYLKSKIDDYPDMYNPVEILSYIAVCIIAPFMLYSSELITSEYKFIQFVYLVLIFFASIITLRNLFSAIGSRTRYKFLLPASRLALYLYYINFPFLAFTKKIRSIILRQSQEEVSRDELSALVESAHEEGSIDQDEYKILKNIMNFSEVQVSDVMTPRTVIFSLPANQTINETVNLPEIQMYSRIPIWEGDSIDEGVFGYVMTKDILVSALKGNKNKTLREICREIYFIPENAELDIALDRFLKNRQHICMVVDEFGGIEGLLTMEDVLETILGSEIVDEADKFVDLRELAKNRRDKRIAFAGAKAD